MTQNSNPTWWQQKRFYDQLMAPNQIDPGPMGSIGWGDWKQNQNTGPMDEFMCCIITSVTPDDNGYYPADKYQPWFSDESTDLLVEVRVILDHTPLVGDIVMGPIMGITDDTFFLIQGTGSCCDQSFDNSNNASTFQSGPITSEPLVAFNLTGIELGTDGGSPPQYGLRLNTGTISNAILTANVITSSMIADGAVGESELANAAVTSIKIADGSIDGYKLADGYCLMPCAPDSGTYVLQSIDGVPTWVGIF